MKLLVSNVGSTSLKFKLFDMPEERVLCEAKIERVGSRDAAIMSYRSHLSGARFSAEGLCIPSYAEGIALFLEKLTGDETGVIKGVEEISAIGFKTVLSRGYYGVHELTDEVMENMREYLYIAPVHNAAYIEAIGQFKAVLPDVPMIGVFETAFHREIPLERALYSIPYEWYEKYGIRKMGYFDEASNEIPLLSHLAPSGPYNVKDFDLAGGMRAMLKELLPKLHGDCLTVTGHTLEENVRDAVVYNRDVIHSLDNPVMTEPGIGVLYGNLAPEGAIVKIAGVPSQLMTYKGKARVFDSLEDGIQALRAGQIHAGDCCVLRFMGLRGRFGTTAFTFQEELKGLHELYNSCAIITDGRFSGGTSGLSIGYVSPEAALGSPLGVIEEGDEVEIDIPARKLHLCISDEEMNRRLAAFHWEFPSKDYPRYLNLFVQNVGSMAKGGIWETK